MVRRFDSPRGTKAVRGKSGTKWAVNRAIARKLRKLDCDPVTLLARIATDEETPIALRYRATAQLAQLLHAPKAEAPVPSSPESEPPAIDIGAAIAANWRDDERGGKAAVGQAADDRAADAENARAGDGPEEACDPRSPDGWHWPLK